ncbi:hypothetical protein [Clostridium oceanicum]|uniref:Uncharacterized protein n=1 Tax=Clostridium oceanicum TaxID=1543 RepID=A0ABN1JA44_9CLOT
MLCNRDKRKLQRCLEDLYCNQCDVCICGCGCCKDIATNVCDCCVDPMEDFLKKALDILSDQGTLTVFLTSGQSATGLKPDITTLEDGIIGGTDINGVVRSIPICQISRVVAHEPGQSLNPNAITLLPAVCTCGECDCCERPTREKLSTFPQGKQVQFFYVGLESGVPPTLDIFEKVGLGIALTSNLGDLIGYSNCKITAITEP